MFNRSTSIDFEKDLMIDYCNFSVNLSFINLFKVCLLKDDNCNLSLNLSFTNLVKVSSLNDIFFV